LFANIRGEVDEIAQQLISTLTANKYLDLMSFCIKQRIHREFLEWLIKRLEDKHDISLEIVDNVVIQRNYLEQCTNIFVEQLNAFEGSISLKDVCLDIVPEIREPVELCIVKLARDSNRIRGTIDRNRVFVHEAYRKKQLDRLLDHLSNEGVLEIAELKANGVKNIQRFAVDVGVTVHISPNYLVSSNYIDIIRQFVQRKLTAPGWIDLAAIEFPEIANTTDRTYIIEQLIVSNIPRKTVRNVNKRFLVTSEFELTLKQNLTEHFINDAKEAADSLANNLQVVARDGDEFELKDAIIKQTRQPDQETITNYTTTQFDLPSTLASALMATIAKEIRLVYLDHITETTINILQDTKKDASIRFTVYLQGLHSLNDKKLRAKLWTELLDYCKINLEILPINGDEQIDDPLPWMIADQTVLSACKDRLTTNLKAQLNKVSDPALILHLAVLLIHGQSIAVNPPGLLKASGKHVPKLLKEILDANLDSPPIPELADQFVALKDVIVGKKSSAEQKRLAQTVKTHTLSWMNNATHATH
jgi:hypothetical protein